MATLAKTYGVTLRVSTGAIEYYGTDTYNFFGGSSDRIAMLKFDAPDELSAIEFIEAATLRMTVKGEDSGDADNITVGLISGSWPGNITGGYATLYGYCNGPTISVYLSTTTTLTEKYLAVGSLLQAWAENPSAYSGLYLRKSSMSLVRVVGTDCDVTTAVFERTAPGAPTSATLSASLAESAPTLTWSGATQGTNNNVDGYEIQYAESSNGSTYGSWTALKAISSALLYGSTTVALASTRGYYRKYRIRATGEYIDSAWKETSAVRYNSAPSAPTSVTATPDPFESINTTVSWSGATDADGNIQHYLVQRAWSPDGVTYNSWTTIYSDASGPSVGYSISLSRGYYIKFRVQTVDAFGVASGYTESSPIRRNSVPAAPTVSAPGTSKTIYNSRPRLLITIGSDTDGQSQTVTASGYTASTSGGQAAGKKLILQRNSSASAGTVSASVVSTDTLGAASSATAKSLTYAEPAFTDASLTPGTTAMKSVHITELRAMVNTVRDYYGLSAYSWAETITAGTTLLSAWAGHIAELRTAIDEIVSYVNAWDSTATSGKITAPAWTSITTGQKPSAAVVQQIRAVLITL